MLFVLTTVIINVLGNEFEYVSSFSPGDDTLQFQSVGELMDWIETGDNPYSKYISICFLSEIRQHGSVITVDSISGGFTLNTIVAWYGGDHMLNAIELYSIRLSSSLESPQYI